MLRYITLDGKHLDLGLLSGRQLGILDSMNGLIVKNKNLTGNSFIGTELGARIYDMDLDDQAEINVPSFTRYQV